MNRLLAIFTNFAFAVGLNNLYVFGWYIVLLIKSCKNQSRCLYLRKIYCEMKCLVDILLLFMMAVFGCSMTMQAGAFNRFR